MKHAGSIGGYFSYLIRYPQDNISIILLSNDQGVNLRMITNEIDKMLGVKELLTEKLARALWLEHIVYSILALEHLMTVEENDDDRSHGKQEVIPGLGIGENRIHDVQVIKDGDQQTTPRSVEQRRQDNGNGDESQEEGTKRPGALRCPAHREGWRMPDCPNDSQDETRPKWRKATLQEG